MHLNLAQGVADRIGKRDLPLKYLDLVALAASADIVTLTDENRILVKEGLNQVNQLTSTWNKCTHKEQPSRSR